MRKINFEEIGMENYGPYKEPFVLECENGTLTLITGPNGIGKTIALDSMPFTFYGITSKGERGDDLVNNSVGKNCHTWVKFTDDADTYTIDRYHKHSKYKNTVRITRNNESKPYKVGHREVSSEVVRLICDRKTFTNTMMFGQKVKDFFTDLNDSDQKAIFWQILDLLKYGHYRKTSSTEIGLIEKSIQDTRNSVSVAVNMMEQISNQIETQNKLSVQFHIDMANEVEEHENTLTELANMKKLAQDSLELIPTVDPKDIQEKIASLKLQLDNVGKEANNIKKDVESEAHKKVAEFDKTRNQKVQEITDKYKKLLEELNAKEVELTEQHNNDINKLKDEKRQLAIDRAKIESGVDSKEERISELKSSHLEIGSECPTCLESITQKSIENIEKITGKLIQEMFKQRSESDKLSDKISTIDKTQQQLTDKFESWKSEVSLERIVLSKKESDKVAEVDDRLRQVKKQIADVANDTLRSRIQDLEISAQEAQRDLDMTQAEYAEIELTEKKRRELESKIAEYNSKIEANNIAIKKIREKEFDTSTQDSLVQSKQKQQIIIEESENKLKDKDAEIKRLEFWKEAFSQRGIPSMLIDQAVPLMNKSMKKYLDQLSNGRYMVSFDTISQTKGGEYRDKFSVDVLDTKTQVNNKKQLSGGQTRLIDIATILTLRDLKRDLGNVEFNIFAFDEIFDALDDANIGYACNILNSIKEDRSLLVVSHRFQDELEADNHIQLN